MIIPTVDAELTSGSRITSLLCVLGLFGDFEDPSQSPCPNLPTLMLHSKHSENKHQEDRRKLKLLLKNHLWWASFGLFYCQLRAIVLDLFFGCC